MLSTKTKSSTAARVKAEHPILFTGLNVNRIFKGLKTQTRRVIKDWKPLREGLNLGFSGLVSGHYCTGAPESGWVLRSRDGRGTWNDRTHRKFCPYGVPGDRLWVREGFWINDYEWAGKGPLPKERPKDLQDDAILYRANGTCCEQLGECDCQDGGKPRWRPSIHMPRWASRLILEVTDVRTERLRAISEGDAKAEGAPNNHSVGDVCDFRATAENVYRRNFALSWDSINGKRGHGWKKSDWVFAIDFKVIDA